MRQSWIGVVTGRLNGSDLLRCTNALDRRGFIPFRCEQVGRWRRAECAEFAHEVRLISVAIRVCELSPSQSWSHGGRLPRSGETGEPLETLRGCADIYHELPVQVPRRDTKL